jgi:hypothetical protein
VDNGRDEALFDPWTRDYALLGLRLDQVAPGYVLAWLGPPAWRVTAAGPPLPPLALRDLADDLLERLPAAGYEPARRAHLAGQMVALRTQSRLANGENIPFVEQATLLLGVPPERVPEATFDVALAELDRLLPGPGSSAERYEAWRRAVAVPPDRVPEALERLAAAARDQVRRHLPLPDEEGIEFVFGADLPYRAYARHVGHRRTRVEVHLGRPIPFDELVDFAAHEAYPGHHTEHTLREHHQFRLGAQGEYAIQLANTPASLVWEGVACCARNLVFGEGDTRQLAAELAVALGPGADPERDSRVWSAVSTLADAQGNAAFLLHADLCPADEVANYLAERLLTSPRAGAAMVELVKNPPWRVHALTYATAGACSLRCSPVPTGGTSCAAC